jgi:hypothetical protein
MPDFLAQGFKEGTVGTVVQKLLCSFWIFSLLIIHTLRTYAPYSSDTTQTYIVVQVQVGRASHLLLILYDVAK